MVTLRVTIVYEWLRQGIASERNLNVRQTYGICAITRVIANERAFKIRFLNMFKNLPAISLVAEKWQVMASERTSTMRSPCDNHAIITTILLGMGGNPCRNSIQLGGHTWTQQ